MIAGLGAYNYYLWDKNIAHYEFTGGEYIPEFKIDYNDFNFYSFICVGLCGLMFFLSLPSAICKKPVFSFCYVIFGVMTSMFILFASMKSYDHERIALSKFNQLCNNSTRPDQIKAELQALIYPYMCTPECRCN